MPEDLRKNIISTLAYYNELEYPMTVFELWKYLGRFETTKQFESANDEKIKLIDILDCLESDEIKKYVEEFNGYYFLKGEKHLVEKRITNTKAAMLRLKRIRKFINVLGIVPFVRMIALTGGLAMKNIEDNSDWDLLIVIKKGRIWIGRTWVTLVVHLMRKRRYENKIKDRICLNYFLAEDSLEIKHKDFFSANEYYFMIPLFGKKAYEKFLEKNGWIKEFKPNFQKPEVDNLHLVCDNKWKHFFRSALEAIFDSDWLENKLRNWEKKKIKNNPKTFLEGSFIEASDKALIFLPKPKGPKIFEEFKKAMEKIR